MWAAGGYGKSTLAAELRDALAVTAFSVRLSAADSDPGRLAARVRAELRRARRSDALAAMEAEGGDPELAFRALAGALNEQSDPLLVVFDDIHHGGPEVGGLLAELTADLEGHHRALLLGRAAIPGLRRLEHGPGTVTLTASDLAFTASEVAELALRRTGRALAAHDAETLRRATDGWAAAVVLAISRMIDGADPSAALGDRDSRAGVLGHLLNDLLDRVEDRRRAGIIALGHLPLLSDEIGRAVGGTDAPGLLAHAIHAGLPVTPARDGWSELPGPVAEYLSSLGPLPPAAAIAAAEVYVRERELGVALNVLLGAGQAAEAARIVAGLPPDGADRFDHVELGALVNALPESAVAAHPRILIHLARACEPVAQLRLRTATLDRARELAAVAHDGPLEREVMVELARDLARDGETEPARALATEVLAQAGEGELAARSRALTVLGQAAAAERTDASLAEAQTHLEQALVLCHALGRVGWTAQVLLPLAISVHHARGEFDRALARLDEFLSELPGRSRHRAVVQAFRADVLIDIGRYDDAAVALDEVEALAAIYGDERAAGYAAWSRARMYSQQGDAPRTAAVVREAERHAADWFAHPTGTEFLAESADLLDRVGLHEAAERQLRRARERADRVDSVRTAARAIDARHGEPAAARAAIDELLDLERRPGFEPRERWRMALLAAHAALRAGDPRVGELSALAFDRAGAHGHPELPLLRDPEMARRLVEPAAAAGSSAARTLQTEGEPLTVSVLGGFRVRRGNDEIEVATGRPAALVKLVSINGGAMSAATAAEALWPDADTATARRRLRNVLNRVATEAGPLVVREDERLRVPEGTVVDAAVFEQEARDALAQPGRPLDAGIARRALEHYHGDLLAGEHEEWVAPDRERLRALYVELLDQLAEEAESRDDYDEAQRLLRRAIDADRYDDRRYLLLAGLLAQQGRRGAALRTLDEGAQALAELELPEPEAYRRLAQRLRR